MSPARRTPDDGPPWQSLFALLEGEDVEARCAAAIVLGRLGAGRADVLRALLAAAERASPSSRAYFLDAIAALDGPEAIAELAPLLLRSGIVREQVGRALSATAEDPCPLLRDLLPRADETVLQAILRILSRRGDPPARALFCEILPRLGPDGRRTFLTAVLQDVLGWPQKSRRDLVSHLLRLSERAAEWPFETRVTLAHVFGALPDSRSVPWLLERVLDGTAALGERAAALAALADAEVSAARARRATPGLVELLAGEPVLISGSLPLLARWAPEAVGGERLLELMQHQVREVAATAYEAALLIEVPGALDQAFETLRRAPQARLAAAVEGWLAGADAREEPLLARLATETDPHLRARLLAVLRRRGERLAPEAFRRHLKRWLPNVAAGEVWERVLPGLGALNQGELCRRLEARASAALRAGQEASAVALLEPLVRGRLASPDARYLLAVVHLRGAAAGAEGAGERAMHLLGPLLRREDLRVGTRLARDARLQGAPRELLLERLERGGKPEKALAARLQTA